MIRKLRGLLAERQEEYLTSLRELVSLESPSGDKVAADRCADGITRFLTRCGFAMERQPRAQVGDVLIGHVAGKNPGPRTLLLAHYDTVWPLGTLTLMPFVCEGDTVRGPGTADMKAGIVAGGLALSLLSQTGGGPTGPVTFLISSDEETGSDHSRALIEEQARQHDRVLVLETTRDDGALKIGRKGVGDYAVTFHGRSAHAGNDPDKGASALREMAHFLFAAEELNAPAVGTTVNLTVARGGTVTNVIAELAEAFLDVRVLTAAEAARVDGAIRGYLPRDGRVTLSVQGGLNRPPFEPGPLNRPLFERARDLGRELGLELEGAVVGGGSDGNFTAAVGIPTLDGLGSAGAGSHARHEHIRLRESLDRVALLAALIG